MKKLTKRISILLAVLMVISMMLVPASAAEVTVQDTSANITIYFSNNKFWSTVNCYYWTASSNPVEWPGTAMTFVETNEYGEGIYSASVPSDASVVFNNGSEQTNDITTVTDGYGYYLTDQTDGKWNVSDYIYNPSPVNPPVDPTTPVVTPTTPVVTPSTGTTIYFDANHWTEAGAWFAVYAWDGNGGETFVKMNNVTGSIYSADLGASYNNVIFCRMDPAKTDIAWESAWNKTTDLTVQAGCNMFKVNSGEWTGANGTWSTYGNVVTPTTPVETPTTPVVTPTTPVVTGSTIYFDANHWTEAGAWFAVYAWDGNGGETFVKMNNVSGSLYSADLGASYNNVIFCRMDPAKTDIAWESAWNQTTDLTVQAGCNKFTVNSGEWTGANGTWSVYGEIPTTPVIIPTEPETQKPTAPVNAKYKAGQTVNFKYVMTVPTLIENISGVVKYDQSVYELVKPAKNNEAFPNIDSSLVVNYDYTNEINFGAINVSDGFDFTTEAVLAELTFKVLVDTNEEISLAITDMYAYSGSGDSDPYVYKGEVKKNFTTDTQITVEGGVDPTTVQPTTVQPTTPPTGDKVVYTYKLTADLCIENVQGIVYYDKDAYVVNSVSTPVLEEMGGFVVNTDVAGEVNFNGSQVSDGYDFTKGDILIQVEFTQFGTPADDITTVLDFLDGLGLVPYIEDGKMVRDFTAEESVVVNATPTTVEPTTVEPTTVEPTTVEPTTVEPTTPVNPGNTTYRVGDEVVYTANFQCNDLIESIIFSVFYDDEYFQFITTDKGSVMCPNINSSLLINKTLAGEIPVSAIDVSDGFDFTTEDLLCTFRFTCIKDTNDANFELKMQDVFKLVGEGDPVAIYRQGEQKRPATVTEDVENKNPHPLDPVKTLTVTTAPSNPSFSGYDMDTTGLVVTYTVDGVATDVTATCTLTGYNNTITKGTQTITASYDGLTATFDIKMLTYGDANLDGKVNILDASLIQAHSALMGQLTGDALLVADTDHSGGVSITDVTVVQKFCAKMIDKI